MIPVLPDKIAATFNDATPASDAASDAAVNEFLARYTDASRPELLNGWTKALGNHFAAAKSRHGSTVSVLIGALKEARAGYLSAQDAIDTIKPMFLTEVAKPPASSEQNAARTGPVAASEFHGILAWAVGQANAADLTEVHARVEAKMPDNLAWMTNITTNGQAASQQRNTHADFWEATDELRRVRDFARSRRVSPWAVLGVVLAHVLSSIPPNVRIPPYVGGYGSLNTFIGLVGPPGRGKGGALGAGRDAVLTKLIYSTGPGSGEGLNHLFAHYDKKAKNTVIDREAVFFSVPEVDMLDSLTGRSGATLPPQLTKAWSGESLTFAYVDPTKALVIPDHSYRLCMVVGIQPGRAGVLLDAADSGMPQRFLWLPTDDLDIPDVKPHEPKPINCCAIAEKLTYTAGCEISLPPGAVYLLDRTRVLGMRGQGVNAALDGHLGLCRAKVAIGLALLHSDCALTVADDSGTCPGW